MPSESMVIASEVIGFISFGFTLLTWLGVYISLIKITRSAPTTIPITLSNLRQEIQIERAALRERSKEGDCYSVFPGRQMRRIGKNESHMKLWETTMKHLWKSFRDLEKQFIVKGKGDDVDLEGKGSEDEVSGSESPDENGGKYYDEKRGATVSKAREARRAMRRRDSHLRDYMGMRVGGLSVDRSTYYNTDMAHRFLWWWKRDDIRTLQDHIQRMQIQRLELDLFEADSLVKRGLAILGNMSGEDPFENCGEGRNPNKGPTGSGGRRRRSHNQNRSARPGRRSIPRSRNASQVGVREIYEREMRRTRRRSDSESSVSRRRSSPPSPKVKVAGSTVSVERSAGPRSRSRAPSVVEYEVVNPGRIWVDVQGGADNTRSSANIDRPRPAHFTSYVRERSSPDRTRRR